MSDRQPKPPSDERSRQPMQQVPKTKLQIVFTLDGVTAEPLLIYQNQPAKAPVSLRRFFTARDMPAKSVSSPQQRHTARVTQAVRDTAHNLPAHLGAVARQQDLENRAAVCRPEMRGLTPEKDNTHERQ